MAIKYSTLSRLYKHKPKDLDPYREYISGKVLCDQDLDINTPGCRSLPPSDKHEVGFPSRLHGIVGIWMVIEGGEDR